MRERLLGMGEPVYAPHLRRVRDGSPRRAITILQHDWSRRTVRHRQGDMYVACLVLVRAELLCLAARP